MKNNIFIAFIIFLPWFSFLCKGPGGTMGPAGDTGKDGKDAGFIYFEGFKENLKCGTCHTPDNDTALYVNARRLQYQTAGHITGTGWGRNTTTCAGCHTTEGFLDRAKGDLFLNCLEKITSTVLLQTALLVIRLICVVISQ